MYMRLAFAVAGHLEPEILVVDEVLAVGDAEFQRKCLGKMGEVAKEGRTVLFVSHQMAAVESLCDSAILLEYGQLAKTGSASQITQLYVGRDSETRDRSESLRSRMDRQGDGAVRVVAVRLHDALGRPTESLRCGQDCSWEFELENCAGRSVGVDLAIGLDNALGTRVAHLATELCGCGSGRIGVGGGVVRIALRRLPLAPGRYSLTLFLTSGGRIVDWLQQAVWFEVQGGDYFGTGRLPPAGSGLVLVRHEIEIESHNPTETAANQC
jgi:lipopolysaccharide transport system ATP-binding protein